MKLTINTSGLSSMLENIGENVFQVRHDTAIQIVNAIMAESYIECPKKTGTLANSQFIIDEVDQIIFGYGGPNNLLRPSTVYQYASITGVFEITTEPEYVNEYAAQVHEDLINEGLLNNGKAKFLEDPISRYAPKAQAAMVNNFTEALKGSVKWKGSSKLKKAAQGRGGGSWIR